jgi:hypothetical protein
MSPLWNNQEESKLSLARLERDICLCWLLPVQAHKIKRKITMHGFDTNFLYVS